MPFLHVTLRSATTSRPATLTLSVARVTLWDPPEHYVFPISDASNSVLTVEVFDMDTMNPDDLLGILKVAVAKFADEMEVSTLENYPLSLESESIG
ncbi:unnamed protein product [Peronospora destructor]|uniref:C2 domain-containing protein n=1 Tax=Peronospora destructor TaxID=86335 RepID=A0AAV0T8Y4_9STRA|nr:unnamed protein product [Peronospora destructor]